MCSLYKLIILLIMILVMINLKLNATVLVTILLLYNPVAQHIQVPSAVNMTP